MLTGVEHLGGAFYMAQREHSQIALQVRGIKHRIKYCHTPRRQRRGLIEALKRTCLTTRRGRKLSDTVDRPFHSQTLSGANKNCEKVNSFWRRNSLNYLQL